MKRFFNGFLIIFIFISFIFLTFNVTHAQWQPDMRLTNNTASSYTASNNAWSIATNGNVVHVAWYDLRDTNSEIYYKRSSDGGLNWGADTRLTTNSSISMNPSVAALGTNVYVVWQDGRNGGTEIYFKQSTDEGLTWGADTRLSNNSQPSTSPSLAVTASALYVVWCDGRNGNNGEIYYKFSTNGGLNWTTDRRLTNDSAVTNYPSVSISGSIVHVVWYDERDGNPEIYYKRSNVGDSTWGSDIRLTNNAASSVYPSISVSGSVLHVVWYDDRDGNTEIYYKRSSDAGLSWGPEKPLSNNSASSYNPSVAVSGSNVNVTWVDTRDGNKEIYYIHSTDGGLNWSAQIRLTNDAFDSYFQSVSALGSVANIAWVDTRDGNAEIYFKHNPNVNYPPPSAPFNLTALAVSTTRINLSWTDTTSFEDGFVIERNTDPVVDDWIRIDSVGPNIVTFADTGLAPGTIYYYRLFAFNVTGNSAYSNTAFDTTLVILPSAPFNLTALAVSTTRINLNWTDTSIIEEGFVLDRSTNAGSNWVQVDSLLPNTVSFADTGLTPSTIYHYRLYAFNSYGNSPYSNIAFDTTFILAPLAPTLTSPADSSTGQSVTPTLVWKSSVGAATYRVQVSIHANFDTLAVNVSGLDSTQYTIPVNVLFNHTWYYWRVNASNTTGTSPWSEDWSFETLMIGLNTYSNEIPKIFKLYNNFPNPFNPATKIRFDIPKTSRVNIIVYDLLGRETEVLYDNILNPGKFEINWNASNYSSGVYFYRIIAGDYVDTKKMVIVK